jgi:lupus La protein
VSDDAKLVRRAQALAVGEEDSINKAVEARSLYATPYPYDTTLDSASHAGMSCRRQRADAGTSVCAIAELMAFFAEQGAVRSIRLRKHAASMDFNGTAFVEMGSVEEAGQLMKRSLVFEGATLVCRL